MTDVLTSLLDAIAAEQHDAGESVESPATWPSLSRTDLWMRRRFGMETPAGLADLWSIRDGVRFNGLTVYRCAEDPVEGNGIRAVNETFARVTGSRYLFVGEADMDAYLHDSVDGGWHAADRVSLDSFERFDTCRELLLSVLRRHLDA